MVVNVKVKLMVHYFVKLSDSYIPYSNMVLILYSTVIFNIRITEIRYDCFYYIIPCYHITRVC